jgi:hypothetical protein
MRRLAVFYCIVVLVFATRAAYAGFATYASSFIFSEPLSTDCGDVCDPCQPLPFLMDSWLYYRPHVSAIIDALCSASLSVVSVWFILTAEEKRLLRTGQAARAHADFSPRNVGQTLESSLRKELKLSASLL